MSDFSPFPEDYLSHFSSSIKSSLICIKTEAETYRTQCSAYSSTPSSIPEFLQTRVRFLENKSRYLQLYNLALSDLQGDGRISSEKYEKERKNVDKAECSSIEETISLKLGNRIITDDMSDILNSTSRIEDAYIAAIVNRIRVSSDLKSSVKFNQLNFRRDVLEHYDACPPPSKLVWCHLLGWHPAEDVKVAHLMPKSLDAVSASYLFGGEVELAMDQRNSTFRHSHT